MLTSGPSATVRMVMSFYAADAEVLRMGRGFLARRQQDSDSARVLTLVFIVNVRPLDINSLVHERNIPSTVTQLTHRPSWRSTSAPAMSKLFHNRMWKSRTVCAGCGPNPCGGSAPTTHGGWRAWPSRSLLHSGAEEPSTRARPGPIASVPQASAGEETGGGKRELVYCGGVGWLMVFGASVEAETKLEDTGPHVKHVDLTSNEKKKTYQYYTLKYWFI